MAWQHIRSVDPMRGLRPLHLAAGPGDKFSDAKVFAADAVLDCIHVFSMGGFMFNRIGSHGDGEGQFDNPSGIAVAPPDRTCNEGYVVVADCGNHRIQVLTADGIFVRQWGSKGQGDGQFYCPEGVAVAKGSGPNDDAEVIVADTGNHRIQVFRLSDGAFLRKWGSAATWDADLKESECHEEGRFLNPIAVCVTPNQKVRHGHSVHVLPIVAGSGGGGLELPPRASVPLG